MDPDLIKFLEERVNPVLSSHSPAIYLRGMKPERVIRLLGEALIKAGKKRGRKAKTPSRQNYDDGGAR